MQRPQRFGPHSALFLDGDYIAGPDELESGIQTPLRHFPATAAVRRLLTDEITAVSGWQFWRSDHREVDFIRRGKPWIEVKADKASAFELDWFERNFPREKLLVVNSERSASRAVQGIALEDFLLDESL